MQTILEKRGGGAPENKLLCHPEDEIRRISKENEQGILRYAQNDKKCAFTLAEVLITLGIIGIIAAMTIPQLIKNYQAKVLETGFKKAYSNLSKAYLMTQQELGVTNLRQAFATYDSDLGKYPLEDEFKRIFYKNLGAGQEAENYLIKNYNNTQEFYTVGINTLHGWQYLRPLKMLPDGSSVGVAIGGGLIHFHVDTNGPYQGPNRLGFDIFTFGVIDNQDTIKPFKMTKLLTDEELEELDDVYAECAGNPCSISSNQKYNGYGCSYYAMNDINPDDNKSGYWKNLPK